MKSVKLDKWKEPLSKLANVVTENSPTILTVFGCAGLVTTVGLTVKATVDATRTVDEHKEEIHRIPQKAYRAAETVRLTWKNYIPVAVTGGISLGCIIGANSISFKRNAALMATYVAAEDKLLDTNVKKESKKEPTEEKKTGGSLVVNANECKCKDEFSGRIFDTSLIRIQEAQIALEKLLPYEYKVTVNELYDELGLDNLELAGDAFGWDLERGDSINISVDTTMDEHYGPIMLLRYEPKPL